MENNGELLLKRIKNNFKQLLSPSSKELADKGNARLTVCGITPANAYLHIRGHNVFDMIRYMGTLLFKSYKTSFEKDILIKNIPDTHYWELEKVLADIRQIITPQANRGK